MNQVRRLRNFMGVSFWVVYLGSVALAVLVLGCGCEGQMSFLLRTGRKFEELVLE